MLIKSIPISIESNLLGADVLYEYDGEDIEFAFYVYKNGRRIYTQWYTESSAFSFDTKGEPGYYSLLGFIKNKSGASDRKSSAPIFFNPSIVDGPFSACTLFEAMLIMREGWEIPMLYYPSAEKTLFVLTPSAVNRANDSLPAFSRFTWAGKGLFKGNVICIADPTLYLNNKLDLGWCLGSIKSDLSNILSQIVIELAAILGIHNNRIVFWGSSAGGFSALAISAKIADSVAVAINAQTDALLYGVKSQVMLIKESVFENLPDETIRKDMGSRVNMLELKKNSNNTKAVLVQNILDDHHFREHFSPYWIGIGGEIVEGWSNCGQNLAFVYKDPRGHVAETEEMVTEITDKLFL